MSEQFNQFQEQAPPAEALADIPQNPKPFLSRVLNRFGISTNASADWVLDWLQVIAVAVLLAWFTMSFIVVRMRVPTGSMEPTIRAGSSFFVDKISYYFRRPVPGDIIVFWHDEGGKSVRYVKRLIAVGGQRVQIKDCYAYVEGQALKGPAFNNPEHPNPERRCYYNSGQMGDQEWQVPEKSFFVLGDCSRNSLDSRFWGFVDEKDFIGEPFLRVWPPSEIGFMNGYFGSPKTATDQTATGRCS